MKIIHLTAENIKKIKAVDITPPENLVQISGKNGSGKSSVLDSIWWALAGSKNIQAQPIRQGEESARVQLNLGEIIVTRRFTEKGSTLTVENAEGAKFSSPQKMLDEMIGELSFDPLAFANMDAKEQYDELKRISKIGIDIGQLEMQNKADYDRRTTANRQIKELEARIGAYKFTVPDSETAVDVTELMNQMQSAADHNSAIDARLLKRAHFSDNIQRKRADAQSIRNQIATLQSQLDALMQGISVDEQTLANAEELPAKIDITQLRAQIDAAGARNEEYRRRQEQLKLRSELSTAQANSDALTENMAARDAAKAKALQEASMPVAGLSLSEGMVLLNGVPFEQCSSAEQLRTSVAIAMASNPKLRVIRIKDGSLLDEDGIKMIAGMAAANDYQVWIERVDSTGKIGIVMEDGSVKGESGDGSHNAVQQDGVSAL